MKEQKVFSAKGFVYGKLWGGGMGSYESKTLSGFSSKKSLVDVSKKWLKSGELDGGMGFESLVGALLELTTTSTITVNGKIFNCKGYSFIVIGKLKDKEFDFLNEQIMNI